MNSARQTTESKTKQVAMPDLTEMYAYVDRMILAACGVHLDASDAVKLKQERDGVVSLGEEADDGLGR